MGAQHAQQGPLDGLEGLEQPLITLRFGQTTHLQEVSAVLIPRSLRLLQQQDNIVAHTV